MIAAMSNLCARGWKASFKIKSALKGIDASPATRLKLFDTLVKPIICYGSEIWGAFNNLHSCESVDQFWKRLGNLPPENFQIKFCKAILGVHSKACNTAVMGEVGRFPMFLYIIKSMMRYYQHIEDVKDDRPLLAAALETDRCLPSGKSWFGAMETILKLFGVKFDPSVGIDRIVSYIT